MSESYRIVVGVDFGSSGDEALRMAIELGREIPNAELHLTAVVVETSPSPTAVQIAADEKRLEDTAKRLAAYVLEKSAMHGGERFTRPVVEHVRIGDPADALHQVAVDVDASLIVVGTRGTKGLRKLVLGSVSERLVKLAHLPVLVARTKDFTGLDRSQTRPEAPRPGQTEADLHAPPSYEQRSVMDFGGRVSRVSGGV